jgi:sorbitol-specific phosphotransferase system component IIC
VLRLIPEFSPGAVFVALGIAALVQGASLGVWLVYTGAGLVLVGLGTSVHETLSARRAHRSGR